MIKTEELISEVISLPTDIRTLLVSKLLESLNPAIREIDELWATEAELRVDDIKEGKVKAIPGEDVFKEIRKKFNK
ncbi:MAG: addiction module protein [Candidatus Brocadiaceae bacterium]|nr:addiction module protein [Candidatus Brocadiaceae bacterium]